MRIIINLDRAGRIDFPLRQLWAGRLASLDLIIINAPPAAKRLGVYLHRPAAGGVAPDPYLCEGARSADGCWTVYCTPFCFGDVHGAGDLRYEVIALDDGRGNPQFLGAGEYGVIDCDANGSGVVPPIIPPDSYARNPLTGKYHKIVAELDEDGNVVLSLDQEGVER